MKTLISTSIFTILALTVSATHADSGVYTSLKAGVSDTKYKNSVDNETGGNTFNEFYNENQSKTIYPEITAAVGFDFGKVSNVNARVELEYIYKDSADFDPRYNAHYDGSTKTVYNNSQKSWYSNKLQSQALMVNGYYDFKNQSKFTPYVSAGAGVTRVKNTQTDVYLRDTYEVDADRNDSDTHFTWAVGAGVAYDVTKNVALDLSYRYVDAGKYEFEFDRGYGAVTKTNADLRSSEYLLGLRYTF